jgi:hypothetical protein
MRDVADQAQGVIDAFISAAISNARTVPNSKIRPQGTCHYCDEDVGKAQLFCDARCATDYEKEVKLRRGR